MRIKLNHFLLLFLCMCLTQTMSAQNCSNATVYDVYNPTSVRFTIAGPDAAANVAGCSLDGDDAIWVKISIPSNALATQMTVTMDNWDDCDNGFFFCTTDLTAAIYSGSCAGLTAIDDCIDMSGGFTNSNNGPWTYTVTAGTDYYYRISEEDGQGGYAEMTFELNSTALPLDLATFDGQAEERQNVLEWTTLWEENVEWFIIEKSIDGKNWIEYDRLQAVGNSELEQEYEFVDNEPYATSYYRLKMVDLDGSTEYSDVISIENEMSKPLTTQIYPNPSIGGIFTMKFSEIMSLESDLTIRIFNVQGQLVKEEIVDQNGFSELALDLSAFPNGLYFLKLQGANVDFPVKKLHKQ